MAQIIRCGFKEMYYPVGINIQYNSETIKQYCQVIEHNYFGQRIVLHCMGSSGAIIAGIIAYNIPNTSVNHIKKQGEWSHDSIPTAFDNDATNIIVDDIIASGSTIKDILCKYPTDCIFDALFISNEFYSQHGSIRERVKKIYCR